MGTTHFSGPVNSAAGFVTGTSASPVAITTASNLSPSYATSSATDGDTRLLYDKLTFTAAGSGETLRAFTVVTAASAAPGGTINGAHISCEMQAGSISGAANALRATIGGTTVAQTGTLAAIQLDSNWGAAVSTVPASAAFMRISESGAVTGKVTQLMNIESTVGCVGSTAGTASGTFKAIKILISGVQYNILASTAVN